MLPPGRADVIVAGRASDTAIFAAKLATGRHEVIVLRHSYSGRSATALSAVGHSTWKPLPSQVAGIVVPLSHSALPSATHGDASSFWRKMRKSLGSKRKELSEEDIDTLVHTPGPQVVPSHGSRMLPQVVANDRGSCRLRHLLPLVPCVLRRVAR